MEVEGWNDLRVERIDSIVGWMIGLDCDEDSSLFSFDIVDMEAVFCLWYSGDVVSWGHSR